MARTPFALLLAAVVTTGCDVRVNEKGVSLDIAEGRASDEWTRTYTLAKGGRIEVANVNGPIEVSPAAGAEAEVRATRHVRSRSDEAAEQLLRQLVIREEVSGDRVKIETAGAEQRGGSADNIRIEYRIHLPPGLHLSVRTQNGGIQGRITGGDLEATTVNGGVTLELGAVTGEIRVTTVNGGITLDIPADTKADLEASAINGGVIVSDELALDTTERARLRVAGRINGGGPRIQAQTTNGGVRIGVARPAPR